MSTRDGGATDAGAGTGTRAAADEPAAPATPQLPRHRPIAVALRYDAERDGAPRVVAKAHGAAAERLAAIARDAGVPIREDAGLAATLVALELDQVVPPALYEALATVLAWAWAQEDGATARRNVGGTA